MSIVDDIHFKRTLRTPSSERLLGLLSTNGMEHDAVAIDLHFLPSGVATGTVTVLDGGGLSQKDIPALLERIDDDFLPGIDLDQGGVTFTVVFARSAESFESAQSS